MQNKEEQQSTKKKVRIPFKTLAGCGCFSLVLVFIAVSIFIVVTMNGRSWLANFLNGDLEVTPVNTEKSIEEIYDSINSQASTFGESTVKINEEELAIILQNQIGNTETFVDIEPDIITLYWPVEIGANTPIFLIVELANKSEGLVLQNLGTRRAGLPSFITEPITRNIFTTLDAPAGVINTEILYTILPLSEDIEVRGISLSKDSLVLDVYIDAQILQ